MKPTLILLTLALLSSCTNKPVTKMSDTKTYAMRLKPGEDLLQSITASIKENDIEAGWIVTCAGSLTITTFALQTSLTGQKDRGILRSSALPALVGQWIAHTPEHLRQYGQNNRRSFIRWKYRVYHGRDYFATKRQPRFHARKRRDNTVGRTADQAETLAITM